MPQTDGVRAVGRPAGCTCDGSGWTWQPSTDHHYGADGVMVRCNVCHSLRLQSRLAAASGLLPSELDSSLADVIPNGPDTELMLHMAHEFQREPWGIWTLWGTYGNAKTLILQAIVNHFRQAGKLAVYMRFSDLLDYVRAGYRDGAQEDAAQRYAHVARAYLVAVDEVDKARLTEYATELQTTFLDDRWRYGIERDPDIRRHTLLAMNYDPADLPSHIYDRLRDNRFGCYLRSEDGDIWHPGITRNLDASMRPVMRRGR